VLVLDFVSGRACCVMRLAHVAEENVTSCKVLY